MQPIPIPRASNTMLLLNLPAVVEFGGTRSLGRLIATHPLGGVLECGVRPARESFLFCQLFPPDGPLPALTMEGVVLGDAGPQEGGEGRSAYLVRWNWAYCKDGAEALCVRLRTLLGVDALDVRSDRFHQLPDGALLYALHDSAQEKYGELPRCPLGVCGEGTATSAAQCALLDDGGEVVRHVRRIESSPASAEVEPDPVPEALHSFARALSSSGFEPFHEDAPPATESVGDMAEIDATASYGECRLSRLISEGSRPPEPRTVPVRGSKTPPKRSRPPRPTPRQWASP